MNEIVLGGCRPTPLAHYLKALGVLRLVSEQKDKKARGFWRQDRFVLGTCLSREELERFFLEEYRPTPIVGPWGARSGFYPDSSESSAREALTQLVEAEGERFSIFREAVEAVRAILVELHVNKKEDVDGRKQHIMELCRARLPDEAVSWLDACYSLLADDARFPPLLGSGGNEGSGSYMSGFMQQIAACLVRRQHDDCLPASLWGAPSKGVTQSQTPGHFIPNAGGANLSNGYGTKASINPWDYILCLEGALVFTAAATRRMDLSNPSRTASFPFTVENSIAGYSTAVAEKNRGEMWVPTWASPATCEELVALFAEGRASVSNRMAKSGVDFARAIASLGVDRGIDRFFRFGFQERNGQNNMAVFLGALDVGPRPNVELLGPIDGWLSSYGWKSQGDRAPASAQRALRTLESSIFALCVHGDHLRTQGVLTALGECERVMATSLRWTVENHLRPVPALDPKWLAEADDGSVEYRLAASIASVVGQYGSSDSARYLRIRQQFESVRTWKGPDSLRVAWEPDAGRDVVWTPGHLADGLNAVFARRLLVATQTGSVGLPDRGFPQADLGDIADFIEGRFDDRRFTQLLHGLLLLDWTRVKTEHLPARRETQGSPIPCAFYTLLKLCFGAGTSDRDGPAMPLVPRIHRLAAGGQSAAATEEALRRLRGSGFVPALKDCSVDGETAQRAAAALLFPLSNLDQERLRIRLLRPDQKQNEDGDRHKTTVKANGVIL